jgi:hypothetical protein
MSENTEHLERQTALALRIIVDTYSNAVDILLGERTFPNRSVLAEALANTYGDIGRRKKLFARLKESGYSVAALTGDDLFEEVADFIIDTIGAIGGVERVARTFQLLRREADEWTFQSFIDVTRHYNLMVSVLHSVGRSIAGYSAIRRHYLRRATEITVWRHILV